MCSNFEILPPFEIALGFPRDLRCKCKVQGFVQSILKLPRPTSHISLDISLDINVQ